jgi:hypothetical protein
MFVDRSSAVFCNCLAKILHELLAQPTAEATYTVLDSTLGELANHRLVLAKTYLATNSTHRRKPDYQPVFRVSLQYRRYTDVQYSL